MYVWGSPSSDSILAFMTITIANTINVEERNNEAEVEDLTSNRMIFLGNTKINIHFFFFLKKGLLINLMKDLNCFGI